VDNNPQTDDFIQVRKMIVEPRRPINVETVEYVETMDNNKQVIVKKSG